MTPFAFQAWHLLPLSAQTEAELDAATANLASYLHENPHTDLAAVAHSLQTKQHALENRRVLVCQNAQDALQALEPLDPQRVLTYRQGSASRGIVFMFPGIGDHYLQMARGLYETEPVFHHTVERCCETLRSYLGVKLRDLLYPPEQLVESHPVDGAVDLRTMLGRKERGASSADKKLNETEVVHPVVFAIEYALASLLMSRGVFPCALLGYSLGEYVAACVAEVFTLEDALRLVAERARMIQALPRGSMLAVPLSKEAIQPMLSEQVSLSGHNGESMCVLAGPSEAISRLAAQLTEQGIACRLLDTTHAFHSRMMEPLIGPLTEIARGIKLSSPRIPYLSNVTGTWITSEEASDPVYWVQHMCRPVRLFEALSELLRRGHQILLEVGPGQSLGSFAMQHPDCTRAQMRLILPTMRYAYDHQPDSAFLLRTLGRLWLLGVDVDWTGSRTGEFRRGVPPSGRPAAMELDIDLSGVDRVAEQQARGQRRRESLQRRKR